LVAGDAAAYRYLPDSTQQFRDPDSLAAVMRQVGLEEVDYKLFMFGTVAIHAGQKPA
jgi:demethylmenaquinone methyltransferase/2-methoxy-6-polyprenyl-1,4-benzoquinol methylase